MSCAIALMPSSSVVKLVIAGMLNVAVQTRLPAAWVTLKVTVGAEYRCHEFFGAGTIRPEMKSVADVASPLSLAVRSFSIDEATPPVTLLPGMMKPVERL